MQVMTSNEVKDFLLGKPRTAKLATVRPDDRPHVAPVWFVLDGEDVVFTTWHTTVKYANLQKNPQVALCVDDENPPYAFVIIEGTATLEPHASDLLEWTTRIATRYFGLELGKSYGIRNGVEGEILVRVKPTRVIAQKGIAD